MNPEGQKQSDFVLPLTNGRCWPGKKYRIDREVFHGTEIPTQSNPAVDLQV